MVPLPCWFLCRVYRRTSQEIGAVMRTAAYAILLGYMLDTVLALEPLAPVRTPSCAHMHVGVDPLWMLSFWLGYAGFVDWCLPYFGGRWRLCVALGAAFGPMSYFTGGFTAQFAVDSNWPSSVGQKP